MDRTHSAHNFSLRPATPADAVTIRQIINQVGINPMALDWKRFILAIDPFGKVIGCGQVKRHADGSSELASIAVLHEWRHKGIARKIIEQLLEQYPGRIYLTCRAQLGPMYQKFGFQTVQVANMPPYFRRISRFVGLINKLFHSPHNLLVMRRD